MAFLRFRVYGKERLAIIYPLMKRRLLPSLLLPVLVLASCEKTPVFYSGSNIDVFHSFFTWNYETTEGDISNEIQDFTFRLGRLCDPYSESTYQNLWSINQTNDPVAVEDDLFDILSLAVDLQEKTEGYFNPLIGKLTLLWKETLFGLDGEKRNEGPTSEEIKAAEAQVPALLREMEASSLVLDPVAKTVQRIGNAHIDLGGLVKGYSTERVKQMVQGIGSKHYVINGGQSSISFGTTKDGNPYNVSLQYSVVPKENTYSLADSDISTSAIYEQYLYINGIAYSHVINPKTGLPNADYSMAFLVGNNSALLDAFSTSVMIAGPEKAREWGAKFGFEYAVFDDMFKGYARLVEESETLTEKRVSAK